MNRVINFLFWPGSIRENPTALQRLGRVTHWLGAIVGGGWAATLLGIAFAPGTDDDLAMMGVALVGLIPLSLGRAARYILANE